MSTPVLFFVLASCAVIGFGIHRFICLLERRADKAIDQAWEDFSYAQRPSPSAIHLHADTYAEGVQQDHVR